jgi:hypothetical protein
MLLLFVCATGDDWASYMWTARGSSNGPGSTFSALFFISWLYVGQWLLMNLFVATVVNNFVSVKDKEDVGQEEDGTGGEGVLLSKSQRQWQMAMKSAVERERVLPEVTPPPPDGEIRQWAHAVVTSKAFNIGMTVVIIANVGVMSLKFYKIEEDPVWWGTYTGLMTLCIRIYYAEAALKLLGLSVSGYFQSVWNRFDFLLVVMAALEEFATEVVEGILPLPPMLLRVMRIARILRILRLLKSFTGLRQVVVTLLLSFPSFLNVRAPRRRSCGRQPRRPPCKYTHAAPSPRWPCRCA